MANVLYMAISRDGFIAGTDDETPWSDAAWEDFAKFVQSCDIVLLGRRTFEIMRDGNEFVKGPQYIVVTEDELLDTGGLNTLAIGSKHDMPAAGKVGIIGGGELNGRLAMLGVLDEMILVIEPMDLGEGVRLFGSYEVPLKLELLGSAQLGETTVRRHFKVSR